MHKTSKHSIEEYFLADDRASRALLVISAVFSVSYFLILLFWFRVENPYLFVLLMLGQSFYLWQGLNYIYTVWDTNYRAPFDASFTPPIDVFITVAGEPTEIVEATVKAAVEMEYPDFQVYILNDGYVAKKENWREMEELAKKYAPQVSCITRVTPGGAKAGNINHALQKTGNPFVVIFDADHVPHKDFLAKTAGYFADPAMGFVQTPQYYKNYEANEITRGAWEQQEIYYGAICKGRNRLGTVTMCGTNMMLRRSALEEVGGMCDFNIAEDFITGMFMHERGWKSYYVPEVLAEGLAPEDFLSYYKQQLRWARGSLELFFKYNPFFRRGLTLRQRSLYLSAAGYYLSGVVVVVNAILPLVFFFSGAVPFAVSTMALAAAFIPYIFLMIYTLQQSTNYAYTFRALTFSIGSFVIHLQALFSILLGRKSSFAVTSKTRLSGNFLELTIPHLAYIGLVACGVTVALLREGIAPSLMTNTAWALINIIAFSPFIAAATPDPEANPPSASRYPRSEGVKPNYGYTKVK
ncbi:glycosyltransferase [Candidatus Parcubacteria bacterium]|nr:glycosyltransferase [Candidatus Parcubacteria bacterium]